MRLITLFLVLFIPTIASAEDDFLRDFFAGEYLLLGKALDSNKTYTGKVSIYRDGNALKLKKIINGQTTIANAALESTLGGDRKVLRIRYQQAGVNYEQTCLWQSDLDNYARISCYLYQPGTDTRDPGLEVLFYDRQAE